MLSLYILWQAIRNIVIYSKNCLVSSQVLWNGILSSGSFVAYGPWHSEGQGAWTFCKKCLNNRSSSFLASLGPDKDNIKFKLTFLKPLFGLWKPLNGHFCRELNIELLILHKKYSRKSSVNTYIRFLNKFNLLKFSDRFCVTILNVSADKNLHRFQVKTS